MNVSNHDPLITSTPILFAIPNTEYTYQVTAADVDGDILNYSLPTAPTDPNMSIDIDTGFITWTPAAPGNADVVVLVSDDYGGKANQDFTITVIDADRPLLRVDPNSLEFDPNKTQDSLSIINIGGEPLNWTVKTNQPWLKLSDPNGTAAATETDTITIVVDRGGLACGLHQGEITIESNGGNPSIAVIMAMPNHEPDIISSPPQFAELNMEYTYQLIAEDMDGNTLTYSLTTQPFGMAIESTGLISWTPTIDGTYPVEVLVEDGCGGKTTQDFTIKAAKVIFNATWTLDESPITITEDIVVDPNALLIIEPGVQVMFDKNKSLQINGTLIARGTSAKPITFTKNSEDYWGCILFDASKDAAYDPNGNYTSGSILEYCLIEYAGSAGEDSESGAIRMKRAHPFINYCTIRKNTSAGINAQDLTQQLKISNNLITNNQGTGISASDGQVCITDNMIIDNMALIDGGGIFIKDSKINVSNNVIAENTTLMNGGGIYILYSDSITITNNSIIRNYAQNASAIYCASDETKDNVLRYLSSITNYLSYNTIIGNTTNSGDTTYTIYLTSPLTLNYNNISGNIATYELYNVSPESALSLNAESNWWDTLIESEVEAKIFGNVDYLPYDPNINTDAPLTPPQNISLIEDAESSSITIEWTANIETDIAGYRVYWDTNSDYPYANSMNIGNETSYIFTNISLNTYFFTVTAYDINSKSDNPNTIVNENQISGHESWYAMPTNPLSGEVWAWGDNRYGQLGKDINNIYTTPVKVEFLSDGNAIAAGDYYSLVLKSDGTVWAWGDNDSGQLGDGYTVSRSMPIQIPEFSKVKAIAASVFTSLALKKDGTVWIFSGRSPEKVDNLSDIESIAQGRYHSLALKSDGTVWAWGYNYYGQLGDGTTTTRNSPVQVVGLNNVISIAGGRYHSLALKSDGTVWAWGDNSSGQLGDGTTLDKLAPFLVKDLNDVRTIAAGDLHSLAIKTDNSVWVWGSNQNGQLGISIINPRKVDNIDEIVAIGGGEYHSLAVKSGGRVWSWGRNDYGQVGDGTTGDRGNPMQINGLSNAGAISGGWDHSIALLNSTVWTWGGNNYGQLGDGTSFRRYTPVQVIDLNYVEAVAAGGRHSLALKSNATVWAWGDNYYGQLGDGTTDKKYLPVQVTDLDNVEAIAAGACHSLALKSDGTVWSWGGNNYGQLGIATDYGTYVPSQVFFLSNITAIAAGDYHSLALKSDGTVWAWGRNDYGQLGDEATDNRFAPIPVAGLNNVIAIAAGKLHSIALKSDRTVWTWGFNGWGQLGDCTLLYSHTPIKVESLKDVIAIAGGGYHTIALKLGGISISGGPI